MNQRQPAKLGRRNFLKKSLGVALTAPIVASLEERALLAKETEPAAEPTKPIARGTMPTGKIGSVEISRLICGGNLISGYAHSRDLIYVSSLLKHYFTDEKIMETWARCEEQGINTMVSNPIDPHTVQVYAKYIKQGGQIQYLAQIEPGQDMKATVKQVVDVGAVGAFLVGNLGDAWTRQGAVGRIGELIGIIKDHGLIAGVAGHELRTPKTVEEAGIAPDFYVKTLHSTDYWSQRRPEQTKDVIDNYSTDNYWCKDPQETITYMATVKRPWIAYKVLAAGAIRPQHGFRHAFANGADFALVGMFDFQVADDVSAAKQILAGNLDRQRPWLA